MVMEKGLSVQEERLPVPSRQPEPLVVTPEYVRQTQTSLALLQDMVKKVLVPGRDYGPPYEGATTDTLYDPGASLIISAFNSYAGHRRVLYFSNEHGKVAIVIEVPIIQRNTGAEVGSGIASCTVSETKYKYRWVREENLENWGYTEEDVDGFKTREKWGHTEYQVPNPELEELLNTIVTMASKRAEVDAAKSLPGVGSALRELFDKKRGAPKGQQQEREDIDEDSPQWTNFWSGMKTMLGDDYQNKCHQMLGVKSMKDWLSAGKSLPDATKFVSEKVAPQDKQAMENKTAASRSPQAQPSTVAPKQQKMHRIKPRPEWERITKAQIPDYGTLEILFCQLTDMSTRDMYRELGVSSRRDVTIGPWDAFLSLKNTFASVEGKDKE